MPTETRTSPRESVTGERPFAHLRATPEERMQILSKLKPFDSEEWRRAVTPATPDELADWEAFLRERKDERERDFS